MVFHYSFFILKITKSFYVESSIIAVFGKAIVKIYFIFISAVVVELFLAFVFLVQNAKWWKISVMLSGKKMKYNNISITLFAKLSRAVWVNTVKMCSNLTIILTIRKDMEKSKIHYNFLLNDCYFWGWLIFLLSSIFYILFYFLTSSCCNICEPIFFIILFIRARFYYYTNNIVICVNLIKYNKKKIK